MGTSVEELFASLSSVELFRYRFELVLQHAFTAPAPRRAILWRGAIGYVLREQVCHALLLQCSECVVRSGCPYAQLFSPRRERPDLHGHYELPAPYILVDPSPSAPVLPGGHRLGLGLTLVGSASAHLPYVVSAIRRLGEHGLTAQNEEGSPSVPFEVLRVCAVDAGDAVRGIVFDAGASLVHVRRWPIRVEDLLRPGDRNATRVRVRFVTPTLLSGGRTLLSFGDLLRSVVARLRDFGAFFCGGRWPELVCSVYATAYGVRTIHHELVQSPTVTRTSRETGERHELFGAYGSVVYDGRDLGCWMPWLRLAEMTGAGKGTSFGNGRLVIEVLG